MDPDQYRIMYHVERDHWWYRGMRRNMWRLLRRYLAAGRSYAILDAGCGTGGTTIELQAFGVVTGIDLWPEALAYAATRGLQRLVGGSLQQLPFRDASFDVWTSFDVLYHRAVDDESMALREAHRILRPGGIALLREPAFDWLRGAHDVGIHTVRRFTLVQLSQAARQAGFGIEHASYGNALLFPLALAKRTAERFAPAVASDLSIPPKPINTLFEALLALEGPITSRLPLPIGLSVVVLARKRGEEQ